MKRTGGWPRKKRLQAKTELKSGSSALSRRTPLTSSRSLEAGKGLKRSELAAKTTRTLRTLKPGEAIPPGIPKRYPNSGGYIRLRWRVGPKSYVEVYEHRVVDGLVTTAEHVHHRNRRRDDNRPENLEHLTAERHAEEHTAEARARARQMARMYGHGFSTPEIGRWFGVDDSTAYRRIAALGIGMRTPADYGTKVDPREVAELYESGRSIQSLAKEYRVDQPRMNALIREGGATIRRPGRPKNHPRMGENSARLLVRSRSGGLCEVCRRAPATNFQHRKAKGQGGEWSACNGLDVCGMGNATGCHGRIHQYPLIAYERGWSVRSGRDPATSPVWLAGHGWSLLRADGSVAPYNREAA